jgi:hypothetical protein
MIDVEEANSSWRDQLRADRRLWELSAINGQPFQVETVGY